MNKIAKMSFMKMSYILNKLINIKQLKIILKRGDKLLKRNIKVTPAYDYPLNDQENAKHRRGCANIIFDITGDNGNVSFSVLTNWFLPETIEAIPDIATDYRGRSQTVYPRILTINSKKELKDMCEINARENRYCYTNTFDYDMLNTCKSLNMYTIKSTNISNDPYIFVKENLKSGSIFDMKNNKKNVESLNIILKYIKQKGLNIVTLDELLNEDITY